MKSALSRRLRGEIVGLTLVLGILLVFAVPLCAQRKTINYLAAGFETDFALKENARFEQQHPDIKVNLITASFADIKTKISVDQASGGGGLDLFVIDCVDIARFVAAGWVVDISDRITAEMKEDIAEFAKEGLMYQGRWYGLPATAEWHAFMYNERMLKDAGFAHPPFTWDGFVEQCLKLKTSGVAEYPYAGWWELDEGIICEFVTMAYSFGGAFFDENTVPIFDQGGAVDALSFMNDMLNEYEVMSPGSLTMGLSEADNLQAAGKTCFRISWGLPVLMLDNPERSKVVGECRVGLVPSFDGYRSASCSGAMGFAMLVGSKNPDAVWKYIEFRSSKEGSKRAAFGQGWMPGWKSLQTDPDILALARDLNRTFLQTLFVVNRPQVPWYHEFSATLREELHNCLTGQKPAAQALADAARTAEMIKAEY